MLARITGIRGSREIFHNKEMEIFALKTLISNVDIKLATASETSGGCKNQIVCVITTKDQILLRYCAADVILKKLDWFAKNEKIIQDAAFDPSSTWLLVLCLDNTLHIVPALGICDKSVSFKCIFSPNEITSFIVPFIGPHDCPNSQKCPNHVSSDGPTEFLKRSANKRRLHENKHDQFSTSKVNELITQNTVYNSFYCDQKPTSNTVSASSSFHRDSEGTEKLISSTSSTPGESNLMSLSSGAMGASTTSGDSTLSSCPYPTTAVWWRTHADENRAVLGYSDGCIVVVRKLRFPFDESVSLTTLSFQF